MKYKSSITQSIIVLIVLFFVFFMLKTQCPERFGSLKPTSRLGASSYNISNGWHYKFQYMDGTVQGYFTAKSDHAKLIYSSNIEEGTIIYQLGKSSDTHFVTLPVSNSVDSVAGVFEKGEQYEIRAIASQAKGQFDFRME